MPPTGHEALDKWLAPQRAQAVARIIKAVGREPDNETLLAAAIFFAEIYGGNFGDDLEQKAATRRAT